MNIIEKNINVSDVEPGMFIKLDYTKSDGSSGEYSVLVVDPNRTNERASTPQLHGYNLDGVIDEVVVEFLFGLNYPIEIDIYDSEIKLPVLTASDAYDMLGEITTIDRPYRIFNISGISSVKRVTIELPSEVKQFVSKNFLVISDDDKTELLEALIEEDYDRIRNLNKK